MTHQLKIAFRYVFSKKKKNLINIITSVSILSLVVGTIALTVVLSAFNGLDTLIRSLYESFDPDLKIMPKTGKNFYLSNDDFKRISELNGIEKISKTVEETAYIKYKDQDLIVRIKGVDNQFNNIVHIQDHILEGEYLLNKPQNTSALLGYQIASRLGIQLNETYPLKIYAAKREGHYDVMNPESYFKTQHIHAAGVFGINQDFDNTYVLVPLAWAQTLFQLDSFSVSALEIKKAPQISVETLKKEITSILSQHYIIKSRDELNEVIFKTNQTEKWVTYFILLFVLIICTFNLVSANTILILDKKHDAYSLRSIGCSQNDIQSIFILTGVLMTIIATVTGLIIGILICYGQTYFHWVTIQQGVVDAYPVLVNIKDVIIIFTTVSTVGFFASLIPAKLLIRPKYFIR